MSLLFYDAAKSQSGYCESLCKVRHTTLRQFHLSHSFAVTRYFLQSKCIVCHFGSFPCRTYVMPKVDASPDGKSTSGLLTN